MNYASKARSDLIYVIYNSIFKPPVQIAWAILIREGGCVDYPEKYVLNGKVLPNTQMVINRVSKYTTGLSGKAGLVEETFTALRMISDGKDKEAVRFAFLQEDILGKDTHESRLSIWKKINQRYFGDWKRVQALSKLVTTLPYDTARFLIYYEFCRSEPILYDAITTVAYKRFANGFNGVDIGDLQAWLDSLLESHPEVNDWSPQTRKKVLSNVLTVLRDFGWMSGVARKTFERVYVPPILAGYVLYSLKGSLDQFGPLSVIESSDWRLFFLDEGDIVSLLKELTHEEHCTFHKQGEVMSLDLKWQNLEEFVNAITRQV
jgi:hypothetical protein